MAKIQQPETYTYEGWLALMGGKTFRKIGHNTTAEVLAGPSGKSIGIRYHSTYVAMFHADGTVTLNTGGWHSSTTKQRLNAVLPMSVRVFQQDYAWYVQVGGWDHGQRIDFEEGMVIRLSEERSNTSA